MGASPLVLTALFFLLSPGVLLTIPPFLPPAFFSGRTSILAAAIHAGVFYAVVVFALGGCSTGLLG
jgi:hypothetical protein